MLVFWVKGGHSLVMKENNAPAGPATLLKQGSSWLDAKPTFVAKNSSHAAAAKMNWEIARRIRAAQGERGISDSELSDRAGLRRQTVANVLMGVVWPETRTLMRICAVLELEITVVSKE
jgi:lambda repressor-like predicted transcriptional regulator